MFVGVEVDYKGEVAGIQSGTAIIRCIILCWIGDYPAQCEVGSFWDLEKFMLIGRIKSKVYIHIWKFIHPY